MASYNKQTVETMDLVKIYELSINVLAYSTFVPLILSWIKLRLPNYLLALRIIFIVSVITSYSMDFFARMYNNNLFVGVTYLTIEFALFGIIYSSQNIDRSLKRFIQITAILIVTFSVINLFFIQGLFNQNSYSRSLISFATICFALIYFWSLLNKMEVENLFTYPMFWINSGILLVAATSFIIFLFSGYLFRTENYDPVRIFWILKNTFSIIRNLLFAYAFWLNFKLYRSNLQFSK